MFSAEREILNVAQKEARDLFEQTGTKPKVLSTNNLATFGAELGYALRLILHEREIIVFAALQWAIVGLAYVIWTRVLDWIPDSVWEEVVRNEGVIESVSISLFITGWTFLIVVVASYPLAILNAAMTAAHYLRSAGEPSTLARCLNLAFRNLGRLWVFTTIDAWITVNAIFDRLPRKRNTRTALDELLYYAWKIGTIGVLPALVAGKGYAEAARESVSLLTNQPVRAIGIRMGYSLICWVVGILAYAGGVAYLMNFHDSSDTVNEFYRVYLMMALPVAIAAGVVAVLIRPFFVVMTSKLYTDVIPLGGDVILPVTNRKLDALAVVFAILLCVLLASYFFGDELGIRTWVESLPA